MLECTISVADNSFPGNKSLSSIAVYLQLTNRLIRSGQDLKRKIKLRRDIQGKLFIQATCNSESSPFRTFREIAVKYLYRPLSGMARALELVALLEQDQQREHGCCL